MDEAEGGRKKQLYVGSSRDIWVRLDQLPVCWDTVPGYRKTFSHFSHLFASVWQCRGARRNKKGGLFLVMFCLSRSSSAELLLQELWC